MTATTQTRPAGWIYLIHITDDPNYYVGQTVQIPAVRIDVHRRTQQWGHLILPGRAGYTIIRRVETTGDDTLDAIALDLAEAEEIARRNPTGNTNRPSPAIFHARMATAMGAPVGSPTRPRTPRPTNPTPRGAASRGVSRGPRGGLRNYPRRPFPWGVMARIPVGILWAWLAVRVGVNVAHETGNAWWPWVVGPMAFILGPVLTVGLLRQWGWLPKRRSRRSRRRY